MAFPIRNGIIFALLSSVGNCSRGGDTDGVESGLFIESDICGPDLLDCAGLSACFDHAMGICQEDGNITLKDCEAAFLFCQPCFPNSRCGSTKAPTFDDSAMIVESDICESCDWASPCFDHTLGLCQEDGIMTTAACQAAIIPGCKPCFPNSRCGATEGLRAKYARTRIKHVLSICSALLSAIGSSTILFKILRDWAQTGSMTPYDRIILGLSSCDIVASITWAINPFLVPSETGLVWAFGTPATCQAYGFLTQLSLSSFWYNCILSYYFLLTVISQVQRKNLVRKCELFMHLSVLFFPITAIIGLGRDWYDNGCWHTDPLITWIVAGVPTIFTYLSLVINNIVIYAVVRKSLQSLEHVASTTSIQKRLKREARTLMFLYVGCFFVTVSPSFVLEIASLYSYVGDTYPIEVLDSLVLPLQGFFNVFIYLRPAYTRFRVANPNKSVFFVLHQALFNSNVPQLHYRSDHPTSFAIAEEDAANPNQALFNSNFRPQFLASNNPSTSRSETITPSVANLNSGEDANEEEGNIEEDVNLSDSVA